MSNLSNSEILEIIGIESVYIRRKVISNCEIEYPDGVEVKNIKSMCQKFAGTSYNHRQSGGYMKTPGGYFSVLWILELSDFIGAKIGAFELKNEYNPFTLDFRVELTKQLDDNLTASKVFSLARLNTGESKNIVDEEFPLTREQTEIYCQPDWKPHFVITPI